MSLLTAIEIGSFSLSSVHFCFTRLLVFCSCLSFCWCFAFSFSICQDPIGNITVELFVRCLCSVAAVLGSVFAFVSSSLVYCNLLLSIARFPEGDLALL